jgi:serine phosphatase RsbU (regulator of sigma subunit)
VNSDGVFDYSRFYAALNEVTADIFGWEHREFHPEYFAQALDSERKVLFCFVNIHVLTDRALQHLRGLGFSQNHHRVLYVGDNEYFRERTVAACYESGLSPNESLAEGDNRDSGGSVHLFATESTTIESERVAKRRGGRTRDLGRPEVKLKAITDLTKAVSRELSVDAILPKLMSMLFRVFAQAEQGFVLLKDDDGDVLRVKAAKTRPNSPEDVIAVSMTVVRHVMTTGEAVLSSSVLDDSRFKGSTALAKMRVSSMLCVPLLGLDDKPFGIIQILTRSTKHVFTEDDLDLFVSLAAQAAMAIENTRLHHELLCKRDRERDLEFATQVQFGFLPKSRPCVKGYAFADFYEAALHVGGDYFDYIPLSDGRLALTIGDVAGKGMPAALLMARVYSSARYQLLTSSGPGKAVSGLNEEIAGSGLGHRFVTFLVMVLDSAANTITVVNAGHLLPLLCRKDGTIDTVGQLTSGLPLGIVPNIEYQEATFHLAPGDTVLMFTDGITEAMTAEKTLYGRERLIAMIKKTKGSVEQLIGAIADDVEKFTDGGDSHDDTCLVGLQRLELTLAAK